MKKSIILFCLVFFFVFGLTCCNGEKSFFNKEFLKENLVSNLPQPKDGIFILDDDASRVYIKSTEKASAYFQRVLEYLQSFNFITLGTISSITADEYYLSSLEQPFLASDFYSDTGKSYTAIYGNCGTVKQKDKCYLTDAHLIEVFAVNGVYESRTPFEYDYFIEIIKDPVVVLDNENTKYSLEIIDENDLIINKNDYAPRKYAPGEIIELYSRPIMDADLVMYINNVRIGKQTTIMVNNEYLWSYKFTMPENDITVSFKIGSESYYYPLHTILNIPLLEEQDVINVRMEKGYIGVAPGRLTNIEYSDESSDIKNILGLLEIKVCEEQDDLWQVTGGGYVTYSIITKDKKYEICITNNHISINQKHYRFLGEYVSLMHVNLRSHSFVTYNEIFDVYNLENEKVGSLLNLADYEFVIYNGEINSDLKPAYYLETDAGKIYVCNDNIFYLEQNGSIEYYSLVGEKNFSELFTK